MTLTLRQQGRWLSLISHPPGPFQNKRLIPIRLFIRGQAKLASAWERMIAEAYASKPALVLGTPALWMFFDRREKKNPVPATNRIAICLNIK